MGDHGRTIEFGANLDPVPDQKMVNGVLEAAESTGLDWVSVQDHPYNSSFLDAWTFIATLVPRTRRVRFVTDVACLPLRPPAMLAKAAASLHIQSGGRVALGLGAGGIVDAIAAMGGPRRTSREAADALIEAVQIARLVWSDQRAVRFDGAHYRLSGLHPGPVPAEPIEIWLGVFGSRLLGAAGEFADGWIPTNLYLPPEALEGRNRRIDESARAAGRDPASIRRAYNLMGLVGDRAGGQGLVGPVDHWVDEITRYVVDLGMDTFLYWPAEDHARQIRVFSEEVVPAVREAVARRRT